MIIAQKRRGISYGQFMKGSNQLRKGSLVSSLRLANEIRGPLGMDMSSTIGSNVSIGGVEPRAGNPRGIPRSLGAILASTLSFGIMRPASSVLHVVLLCRYGVVTMAGS
jgi:hypothetical protein